MIRPPVAGRRRPRLLVVKLELPPVRALDLGGQQLVPVGCVTHDVVDRDVARSHHVTGGDGGAGSLQRGLRCREIEFRDDVEVGHVVIVRMPLLPCLHAVRSLRTIARSIDLIWTIDRSEINHRIYKAGQLTLVPDQLVYLYVSRAFRGRGTNGDRESEAEHGPTCEHSRASPDDRPREV